MKCPYCGSSNVERVKEWDMPKMGYHVTHYMQKLRRSLQPLRGQEKGVRVEGGVQAEEVRPFEGLHYEPA